MDRENALTPAPRLYVHLGSLLIVPLITSSVVGYVSLATDAAHEAMHIAVAERPDQIAFIALALYLACVALRTCAEWLIAYGSPVLWESDTWSGRVARFVPRLFPIVIATAIAAPIMLYESSSPTSLPIAFALALIGFVVALIGPSLAPHSAFGRVALALVLVGAAFGTTALLFDFKLPVERAGPMPVLLAWTFCATVFFTPLAALASRTRLPLLLLLFLYAAALSAYDVNDNHMVRGFTADMQPDPEDRIAADARGLKPGDISLSQWLESRTDKLAYSHYPIFLITTEGGGMRAAYYTASILAALQDQCPAFAEHVYGISAVSGGSLGAAAFTAMLPDADPVPETNPGCEIGHSSGRHEFRDRARKIFAADFLTPTLSATLFPDALQRVLPFPVDSFDRARALEAAFERSWQAAQPDQSKPNRLAQPFSAMYRPREYGRLPRLYLLATQVATGDLIPFGAPESVVVGNRAANRQLANGIFGSSAIRLKFVNTQNVSLSTAAVLSARFPYLTPAGAIPTQAVVGDRLEQELDQAQSKVVRFVDGGYFENSGSWFANGLLINLLGQKFDAGNPGSTAFKEYFHGASCDDPNRTSPDTCEDARKRLVNAQITVLVLRSTPCDISTVGDSKERRCQNVKPSYEDHGSNELLSPIRTLLNARDGRAKYADAELRMTTALIHQLCGFNVRTGACSPALIDAAGDDPGHIVGRIQVAFSIEDEKTDIPLTWLLSERSREAMDKAIDGAIMQDASDPSHANNSAQRDEADGSGIDGSLGGIMCAIARRDRSGDKSDEEMLKKCAGVIAHTVEDRRAGDLR